MASNPITVCDGLGVDFVAAAGQIRNLYRDVDAKTIVSRLKRAEHVRKACMRKLALDSAARRRKAA